MNPLKPLKVFTDAITVPIQALFVIGITFTINMFTSPDHLWFQWAALGMVIAVLSAWARAAKALALTLGVAGVAGLAWFAWKKFRQNGSFKTAGGVR